MKSPILTLILLFTAPFLYACSCGTPPLSPAIYANMSYVAVVKVTKLLPLTNKTGEELNMKYAALVEELMLFKGNPVKKISIWGGRPGSPGTSCDIGLDVGQEWIILANTDSAGVPELGFCGYNKIYREAAGFRNWENRQGMDLLDFIVARHTVLLPGRSLRKDKL